MKAENKIKVFLSLLLIQYKHWNEFKVIKHCFESHKKDCGGKIKFTLLQYAQFWVQHKTGDKYTMATKESEPLLCTMVYYPISSTYDTKLNKRREVVGTVLKQLNDLRAVVEIKTKDGTELRETPIHYLENIGNVIMKTNKDGVKEGWFKGERIFIMYADGRVSSRHCNLDMLAYYWSAFPIPELDARFIQ